MSAQPDPAADDALATARRRLAGLVERLRVEAGAGGGFEYEPLRRRLLLFFQQHDPVDAEALADDALDRLARRLDEGTLVERAASYAFGIAKRMLFEVHERQRRRGPPFDEAMAGEAADVADDDAPDPAAIAALQACLAGMKADNQRLLFAYYEDDDARRITTRRALASRLGIGLNALRNRALRLRSVLEACVRGRLGAAAPVRRDEIVQKDTLRHD